ncbi:hypothetical protein NDN08_004674 [Rhodosorus marinus]|uniref:GLTSCR protein conserved domain-containing protein n=1 Tax=Rhodosorus marinus TaxID=101924 RepID=A0AAV8ULX7_9RHOD|nr:hypothetical protein NDN08_004674 [Rhodosorus marinus]
MPFPTNSDDYRARSPAKPITSNQGLNDFHRAVGLGQMPIPGVQGGAYYDSRNIVDAPNKVNVNRAGRGNPRMHSANVNYPGAGGVGSLTDMYQKQFAAGRGNNFAPQVVGRQDNPLASRKGSEPPWLSTGSELSKHTMEELAFGAHPAAVVQRRSSQQLPGNTGTRVDPSVKQSFDRVMGGFPLHARQKPAAQGQARLPQQPRGISQQGRGRDSKNFFELYNLIAPLLAKPQKSSPPPPKVAASSTLPVPAAGRGRKPKREDVPLGVRQAVSGGKPGGAGPAPVPVLGPNSKASPQLTSRVPEIGAKREQRLSQGPDAPFKPDPAKKARLEMAPTKDQLRALNPDCQTPFKNGADVWSRLAPYHVFLTPVLLDGNKEAWEEKVKSLRSKLGNRFNTCMEKMSDRLRKYGRKEPEQPPALDVCEEILVKRTLKEAAALRTREEQKKLAQLSAEPIKVNPVVRTAASNAGSAAGGSESTYASVPGLIKVDAPPSRESATAKVAEADSGFPTGIPKHLMA